MSSFYSLNEIGTCKHIYAFDKYFLIMDNGSHHKIYLRLAC